MSSIGVVVFSSRGMRSLEGCLRSIRWADAVVILHLDGGEPPMPEDLSPFGPVERAFSIEQVDQRFREKKTDWILHLWGEERLNEKLQAELRSLRTQGRPLSSMGYRLEIRSRLLNRWVKGSLWGPSPALRLTPDLRDLSWGWWAQTVAGDHGDASSLQGWIEDYTPAELAYGVERINQFSAFCAERLARKDLRFGPFSAILSSIWVGMRLLAANRVAAQGLAGLTLAILAGYSVLLGGAKQWEKENNVDRVLSRDSEFGREREH